MSIAISIGRSHPQTVVVQWASLILGELGEPRARIRQRACSLARLTLIAGFVSMEVGSNSKGNPVDRVLLAESEAFESLDVLAANANIKLGGTDSIRRKAWSGIPV